ncbi:uncharacterized protein LOC103103755 [Monodelphis domestica]|uniref:uncharacterized protein LOC103103755 n=1 Tax=Monodelphis domestica TaxID=13616 RepID=UPI0024E20086|nr:uncharacterized protein LOC103103755 [Monodelphis domestica]XP_056665941.1 uncharacterized protein LOC103103755 [Monodelphis domestica]XP_056665942.1 uncharacterized protein LOC103103755 [Monodelphis domestica]
MSGSLTCNGPHPKACYKKVSNDKDLWDPRFSWDRAKPSDPFLRISGRQPKGPSGDNKIWLIQDHLQRYPRTNETLYVTPEEFCLWMVLQETLDLSLWKVQVGWQLIENSAIISFFGPQKVASEAKTAISKLMIFLNSTVRMNLWPGLIQERRRMSGFFQLGDDLSLFLWKGEACTFRASVTISLSSSPMDRHSMGITAPKVRVLRQHIVNERGIPQVLLQVTLLSSWSGHSSRKRQASKAESQELIANAVTLALQAASQEKSASVVIHPSDLAALAKGITLGVKAFKSKQPPGSSLRNLTIAANDNDFVAECEAECCRWWPRGKDHHVLLPYVLSSWEAVKTKVVVGSLIDQKTDVVVLPWFLKPHNRNGVWETSAQVQAALKIILDAQALFHGNIITLPASSLPGLHCQILYIICLDIRLIQQHLEDKQVIQQVVWSCLNNFLGSFLESISFPMLDLKNPGNSNPLCIMLEEINNFLKEKPNTWMKLVQIVQPPRAATTQKMTENFKTPPEAIVGLCQKEDCAFIRYLNDFPAVFQEFEGHLRKIGCVLQTCVSSGVLKFIAEGGNIYPSNWEKAVEYAFQKNKKRYVVYYESNSDILNVLKNQQSLVKSFANIQEYEGPCFVGPTEEVKMFIQCVQEMAFNEKLVCVEHPILHLPRYTVVKKTINKLLLPHSPVTIALGEDPLGMITFQGPQQNVLEVERQFYSLLSGFKDWPVLLSPFQVQFIQSQGEEFFNENFFLAQDILAVLSTSDGVRILGLDCGELVQAEELLKNLVCERRIDIAEEVQWAASGLEWKALLIAPRSKNKVTFYSVKSQQNILTSVVIVGTKVEVAEAETNIREYLMTYSAAEDRVIFPRPELAEARENLLQIMNWGDLKVNVWIEANHSTLTLILRGPRRYVKEARGVVQTDLDSLVLRTIPIRHREVQQYLSRIGATVLLTFAKELQCLVKMQVPEETTNALLSDVSAYREESELASAHELLRVLRRYRKEHFTLGDTSIGLVQVLGREVNLNKFQEVFDDFINGYYSETFNSDKIVTLSEDCLQEVLDRAYYFPLNLQRHGKLLQIQGFQEDVRKAATAVQALIQEAQDTDRAEALKSVVQWQYDFGNTELSPFDKTTNLKLEEAYRKEEETAEIMLDSRRAQVSLKKRKGLVPDTGKIFNIKRNICIWEMSIPQHWEPMDDNTVKTVTLSPNLKEYQEVARKFMCSMVKNTINKIERIQNPYLWTSYIYKRNWMEKKNPPGVQNEKVLFHGTPPQNCLSITEHGLKSTCRKNGMYGQGIYFAKEAYMSSQYCGHQRYKLMFQVRVLTGEYSKGDVSITFPPEKPGGGRYDSLVDSVGMPKIFVTFFDDHSYPEYLITYK